jgi:type II secretory pathway component PulC
MSESRKMRVVAVAAAVLAMVFTLVAVIVVLTRDSEPAPAIAKPTVSPVSDHVVRATDVMRLQGTELETVYHQDAPKGMRVKDPAFATALGLQAGDVITAISGKPMLRESDANEVMSKLSLLNPSTLYVEVVRGDHTTVVRWKLDGDLREARRTTTWNNSTLFGSNPYSPPALSAPTVDDAVLDAIEKIDETHYKISNTIVDALLANPMGFSRGVRVVPSIRNGQPDGFKLYAIRPSSLFAKIGFMNGDTIHSINGFDLATPDKALEAYTKLKDASSVQFDITRRGKPVTIDIQIIK